MQTKQKSKISISINTKPYAEGAISLSGPSATGKSTLGNLIAKEMNIPFFDLDEEIIKKANKKNTKEVIQTMGHEYFKQLQHTCLQKIIQKTSGTYILAAGGEIIRPGYNSNLIEKNRQLLQSSTYNINLSPSKNAGEIAQILYPRLNNGKRDTRTKNIKEFHTYIKIAIPQYIDIADMIVLTYDASIEEVLLSIMSGLSIVK